MECALIPPVSLLAYNNDQRYQLMLPHLLNHSATYKRKYKAYAKDRSKYVILDNGAAEGVKPRPDQLADLAIQYKVQEVVAPDVLGNYEQTVVDTHDFMRYARDLDFIRLGIVAQGRNVQEAMWCVAATLRSEHWRYVNVVYLPRLLVTPEQPQARISLAQAIHQRWPDLQIHFLGASRHWLQEALAASRTVPFVRSIDTSVPFTEATYGRLLGKTPTGLARPDDYFDWSPLTDASREIVKKNVGRYIGWTKGESTQKRSVNLAL